MEGQQNFSCSSRIFISTTYLTVEGEGIIFLDKINRSLITIIIFWTFHQAIDLVRIIKSVGDLCQKIIELIIKAIKILIILGAAAVLELWGIKIGPIIWTRTIWCSGCTWSTRFIQNLISGILVLVEKIPKLRLAYVEDVIEGS